MLPDLMAWSSLSNSEVVFFKRKVKPQKVSLGKSSSTATPSTALVSERRIAALRARASSPENKLVNSISVPTGGYTSVSRNWSSPPWTLTSLACASAFVALPSGSFHRASTGTSTGKRPLLRRPTTGISGSEVRLSEVIRTLKLGTLRSSPSAYPRVIAAEFDLKNSFSHGASIVRRVESYHALPRAERACA